MADMTDRTAAVIAAATAIYNTQLDNFKSCNLIERTIIQQINTAIDPDCLADLIDDDTGLLEGTVPVILASLFATYGSITPQTLATAKTKLEETTYNHARPIANLFSKINEYANLAEAANTTETPAQLINMGLIILTRCTIFSTDIRTWHARTTEDKTWPNFKDHFKEAQKAIRQSQPTITTDALGYHGQANSATDTSTIVNEVITKLTAQRDADTASFNAEQIAENQMQQHLDHLANSATQNQAMMTQMAAMVASMNGQRSNQGNSHSRRRGGGRGCGGQQDTRYGRGGRGGDRRSQPPPAQPRTPILRQYCWTHGNCGHNGSECNAPSVGHIPTATYENTQHGSEYNFHLL